MPFCWFWIQHTESHFFQQMTKPKQRIFTIFTTINIKWMSFDQYFHFVCAYMAFFSDTNRHCDVTVESQCAQSWQPFKGPGVFPGRHIVVKRVLHLNYCKTIRCCTTQNIITVKVLRGHFMCKIDNSKAKVALDPDGIKAKPTLGSGSALTPLESTFMG